MANEKMRKRLLYDLSPIPTSPVNDGLAGKFEPEVRVVFRNQVLVENDLVRGDWTLGTDADANVILDEKNCDVSSFKFVTKKGSETEVYLEKDFSGYVMQGEERSSISEFVEKNGDSLTLDKHSFVVFEFGDVSVVVMLTHKEKFVGIGGLQQLDVALIAFLLVTFGLGIFLVNMLIETPPVEVDIFEIDNRFAKLITEAQDTDDAEDVEEEKKVKLEKPKEGLVEASQQRKSLGEEGRVGNKKSRVANAQGSSRRGLDNKVAQSSGIMGALSSGAAAFDRVFGGGGLGAGMEKNLGSVTGISGVDQFGSGGLGTRGFGMGGGGNALGIGGLGTRGRGGGGGAKYGMAAGRVGRKGRSAIRAGGAQSVIMGALDRSVIDAYIRRNLAKIRWCYEKELAKDPKLFGKIVINFIIGGTGKVKKSGVKRTTMQNKTVERCVARQIKKIRFPKPKGGGIVIVNYPFVFKHSEG